MFLPSTITLQPGDSGDFVAELQRRLAKLKYYPEEQITQQYDALTTQAVRQFQGSNNLQVDGVAGPKTLRRLNGVLSGNADETDSATAPGEAEKPGIIERLADNLQAVNAALLTDALFGFTEEDAEPAKEKPAKTERADKTISAEKTVNTAEKTAIAAEVTNSKDVAKAADKTEPVTASQQKTELTSNISSELKAESSQLASAAAPAPTRDKDQELLREIQQYKAPDLDMPTAAKAPPTVPKPPAPPARDEVAPQPASGQEAGHQAAMPAKTAAPEKPVRSAFVQKIINYLEARLPTETVREVLREGANMLRAGVREAPISGEASIAAPARAPEIAAPTPEQTARRG